MEIVIAETCVGRLETLVTSKIILVIRAKIIIATATKKANIQAHVEKCKTTCQANQEEPWYLKVKARK